MLTIQRAQSREDEQGVLVRGLERQRQLVAWMDLEVGADQIRKVLGRRRGTGKRAGEDVDDAAGWLEPWHFDEMLKRRCPMAVAVGKRGPELHAVQAAGVVVRCPLCVRD